MTIDPDGNRVQYTFDWGDGSRYTTGFYYSGTTKSSSHKWTVAGTYNVKAAATDSVGASSHWSSPLVVSITGSSPNAPPTSPSIPSGSTSSIPGTSYSYSTSATDPNGDQVKYTFD